MQYGTAAGFGSVSQSDFEKFLGLIGRPGPGKGPDPAEDALKQVKELGIPVEEV